MPEITTPLPADLDHEERHRRTEKIYASHAQMLTEIKTQTDKIPGIEEQTDKIPGIERTLDKHGAMLEAIVRHLGIDTEAL